MSNFNTLLHGQPTDVLAVLETEALSDMEVKAVLSNAFKHINTMQDRYESEIERLESQIQRLTERMESGFADLDMFP